jgi:tungstate transport system substrate-binding protein
MATWKFVPLTLTRTSTRHNIDIARLALSNGRKNFIFNGGDMRRRLFLHFAAALFCASFIVAPAIAQQVLKLSTTTSTENSGLLKYLLPEFEAKTGIKVQVISVGTGKALELAKNGDVDVTLVHARPSEDKFVADGHGVNRRDVMYNDFIIVGPASDPAGIKGTKDVLKGLKQIVDSKAKFISRGDNSGTDQMEKAYWKDVGTKPDGKAYVSAGLGMGEVLNMASELQGYTLTDRATYSAYRAKTGLAIMVEGDPRMFNPYGIIAVSPAKYKDINYKGAMQLIDWITSPEGQQKIASFKVEGQQLFFPTAVGTPRRISH